MVLSLKLDRIRENNLVIFDSMVNDTILDMASNFVELTLVSYQVNKSIS